MLLGAVVTILSQAAPQKPDLAFLPSAQVEALRVVVMWAAVTKVRYKEISDYKRPSESQQLLLVLGIDNQSETKKLPYGNWQADESPYGKPAALRDEHGNIYSRMTFGAVARVYYQTSGRDSIYPKKTYYDVLVFEPPIDKAEKLTLTLPGFTVGLDRDFVITIPRPFVYQCADGEIKDGLWYIEERPAQEARKRRAEAKAKEEAAAREREQKRRGEEMREAAKLAAKQAAEKDRLAKEKAKADAEAADREEKQARKRAKDAAEREKERNRVDGLELVSFGGIRAFPKALLRILPSRRTTLVKEGQELGGWKVSTIDLDAEWVVVTDPDGQKHRLKKKE